MDPKTSTFSYKDLLFGKLNNAIICSIISQVLVLHICLVFIKGNLMNPLSWCTSYFNIVTSFSTWLYMVPHLSIIFAQCLICAKDYVLNSKYNVTRFQKLVSVLSLYNVVLLILYSLVGAVQVWIILSLNGGDYKRILQSDDKNTRLIEEPFFLIIGGLFTGVHFFGKVYLSDKRLPFPLISQTKMMQFKSRLISLVQESFRYSLNTSILYVLFYAIIGGELSKNFSYILGIEKTGEFQKAAYFYHYLFSALYFFNMNIIKMFFKLFLTEPIAFPLEKSNENILTLQDAINMDNLPIVQSLACLDFYITSLWSPVRRQVFFKLSQPGGHPRNWNHLIESVLKLLTSYTELVEKTIGFEKPLNKPKIEPICQLIQPKFQNLRNMTACYSPETYNVIDYKNSLNLINKKPDDAPKTAIEKLFEKINQIFDVIKTLLGINYMFGQIPQAHIEKCLDYANVIVWTSQGVSEMVCASLKEDRYGIVQKDIPVILTALVTLNQILEKLHKSPNISKKMTGIENIRKIKFMISGIKRSLFNINQTFKPYLSEFPVNAEVLTYLNSHC